MTPLRALISLAFLAVLLAGGSARAELLDITAENDGDRLRILFVFDAQPGGASITTERNEARATIAGVHAEGRLVRPAEGSLRQISLADRPLGVAIGAVADRPIMNATAEVFENSVLFEIALSPAPPEPLMAETPELEPEPEPGPAPEQPPAQTAEAGSTPESRILDSPSTPAPGDQIEPAREALPDDRPVMQTAEAAPEPEPEPEPAPPPARPEPEPQPAETPDRPVAPPLPPAPAGAAAELLAARLDALSCQTAANTVSSDPWALDALYDHGACLARDGERARAREVFDRLATFDPTSPRAHVGLGVLLQDAGDRAGAEDHYERAMAANPDDGLATMIRILRENL